MKSHDPNTLYLVDISSFIFRAFFAIRNLKNAAGEPTNAVFGVANMIAKLVDDADPEFLAVVYDSKEPSFRKDVYKEYKANRSAPPDDLIPQFDRIEELVSTLEIFSIRRSGIEADDLIATLARQWLDKSSKHHVVVVTGDKDLMQLVGPRVKVWDTMKGVVYSAAEVKEKFGVGPEHIRDYLALIGDSSDNIPGVEGIGPKTAVQLLEEHGSMEGVLKAAKAGKISGKKGETLVAQEANARLSYELVTLKEDLNVPLDADSARIHFHLTPACEKFLKTMDFHSLATKWKARPGSAKTAAATGFEAPKPKGLDLDHAGPAKVHTVATEKAFEALLEKLHSVKAFGFDLETTSLDPYSAEIVGLAFAPDSKHGYYIPVGHQVRLGEDGTQLERDWVLKKLAPILKSTRHKKIGQNLKYDLSVLRALGFECEGLEADTMVAAYLLDPTGRHSLQTLALKYLDYEVLTYEAVTAGEKSKGEKSKDAVTFDQVPIPLATRYSAEDALVAVWLWEKLEPALEEAGLLTVFETIERPLVPVLMNMEMEGVAIDVPWLKKLSKEFEHKLQEIERGVHQYSKTPVNLNSPKQLQVLLFEDLKLPPQGKTKTGLSTDADVLEKLSPLHEVPRLLLEHREIAKLKGTYVDPLPEMVHPKTGRIHARFHQTVTATGRLSSSDPNLQNIPIRTERGQQIRRAFIARPGHVLVGADYSQIELRLLAHMSKDPDLLHAFQTGEDVHKRTAAELFGVKVADVTDSERSIAKAINFGLMYGKTPFGLSQELRIPLSEAKKIIDTYFTRYAAVKKFLDGLIAEAKEAGVTTTLMGRRRKLPELQSSNPAIRNNAERMAMNTPIQGTAADLIKIAMIRVDRALREAELKSRLIIQVHDELVIEAPHSEVKAVQEILVREMEGAMKLDVPLKVQSAVGENWQEL